MVKVGQFGVSVELPDECMCSMTMHEPIRGDISVGVRDSALFHALTNGLADRLKLLGGKKVKITATYRIEEV